MDLYQEIEKSFPKIEKLFTETSLSKFAQTPYGLLNKYQVGLGTMTRFRLLRRSNALYKAFIREGFTDKDEMTLMILREFRKHLLAGS